MSSIVALALVLVTEPAPGVVPAPRFMPAASAVSGPQALSGAPAASGGAAASSKPEVDPRDTATVSPDPAMRRYMAAVLGEQSDAHSLVLLLLLAQDSDAGVREGALQSAYGKRCSRETESVCNLLMAVFTADTERDIAWEARDWLLERDMDLALDDADKAYKLDLLAKLGGSPTIPDDSSRHLLRCLSADADVDVQDNAAWLLEQQP